MQRSVDLVLIPKAAEKQPGIDCLRVGCQIFTRTSSIFELHVTVHFCIFE